MKTPAKRGPKPLLGDEILTSKQVTIDRLTIRKLLVVGGGNISAAVRLAADIAYEKYQSDELNVSQEKAR